jgi:hypothetical protein
VPEREELPDGLGGAAITALATHCEGSPAGAGLVAVADSFYDGSLGEIAYGRTVTILPLEDPRDSFDDWRDLLAGAQQVVGYATRTTWSGLSDRTLGPAWLMIIVERDQPARFLLRRDDDDRGAWFGHPAESVSSGALATAADLRRVFDGHVPPIPRWQPPGPTIERLDKAPSRRRWFRRS